MYSESDLDAAVTAGALSAAQAQALRDYVSQSRQTPVVDEEHFRLLTGFNDIFVSIAAVILLVAVGWIGNAFGPRLEGNGPSPFMGLLIAATAWGLAEFFTRIRRMALPSILLLLAFVGGVAATVGFSLAMGIGEGDTDASTGSMILAGAALSGTLAAWVHWRRFRVPITIAAGAAAAALLVSALIAGLLDEVEARRTIMLWVSLLLGIGIFLFAMRWDSSDPKRETRRSDVAFWLHLLAAPMIVHPVFSLLGLNDGDASVLEGLVVIAVYVALGITALAIDRRALLVSALVYVLWALSNLFKQFGAIELNFALTAFVIGSALLLLSAFWTNARRWIVEKLPASLQARLPVLDRISPVPAS